MYLDFFKLKDYPFRLTPDTEFLYMSPAHSRAISYMEYAVFNQEGFVVITGEIGSGKTTLIQKLLMEMDEDINVAKIFQTQLDEVELLQAILVEFGMNPFSAKKVELLNMLNQYLIDSYTNNKRVVLIVDDAQNLSSRVLDEICMLSGVETQKEKILHVILVGQPELNQTLESPELEQLLQRISLRYHMRTLTRDETKSYMLHRMEVAGSGEQVFDEEVFDTCFKYTGGTPRLINTLCDTALTCAYADGENSVSAGMFDLAIEELQWSEFSLHSLQNRTSAKTLYDEQNADSIQNKNSSSQDQSRGDGGSRRIESLALVEIAQHLKRIADYLENFDKK